VITSSGTLVTTNYSCLLSGVLSERQRGTQEWSGATNKAYRIEMAWCVRVARDGVRARVWLHAWQPAAKATPRRTEPGHAAASELTKTGGRRYSMQPRISGEPHASERPIIEVKPGYISAC
jgi:hypothetical protein